MATPGKLEHPPRHGFAGVYFGAFPGASLAQWVLIAPLLGIFLAVWLANSESPEIGYNQIVLAGNLPRIAVLRGQNLRILDATTGRELYRELLPLLPIEKDPESASFDWDRLRWPGSHEREYSSWRFLTAVRAGSVELQFWPNHDLLQVTQNNSNVGRTLIFVSLANQRKVVWHETFRDGYTPAEFVLYGKFLVGVSRIGGPNPFGAKGTPVMAVYDSLMGEVSMVFDPEKGEATIDDDLKKKIVDAIAQRKWKRTRVNSDNQKVSDEEVELIFPNSTSPEENVRWEGYREWRLKNGGMVRGLGAMSARSHYWFTGPNSNQATRAKWPFAGGDTFDLSSQVHGEAAVVGDLRQKSPRSFQVLQQTVYWDLKSGKVLSLPEPVYDARIFEGKLLARAKDRAFWLDLNSGQLTTVVRLSDVEKPGAIYAFLGWIVAWLSFVQPTCSNDGSRRFGLLFAPLALGAISICHWGVFPDLNMKLLLIWLGSGVFLAAVITLLISATLRRTVSLLLLCTSWAVTIFLICAYVAFANKEVYDPRPPKVTAPMAGFGFPGPPVAPPKIKLAATLWIHFTEPGGVFRASLGSLELAATPEAKDPSGARFVEESHAMTIPTP